MHKMHGLERFDVVCHILDELVEMDRLSDSARNYVLKKHHRINGLVMLTECCKSDDLYDCVEMHASRLYKYALHRYHWDGLRSMDGFDDWDETDNI